MLGALSESWETAKTHAIERGVKISPTPFGYQRQEDGTLSLHPDEAPIVREAFLLAGRDIHSAMMYLREQVPHRTWNLSTVRRTLASPTYVGESRYGDDIVNSDAHEPLVSRAQWAAAQSEPETRRRSPADFPLSGFATCAGCGGHLIGSRGGVDHKRAYRCAASLKNAKVKCKAPATMLADRLEDYAVKFLREHWEREDWKVEELPRGGVADVQRELEDAEEELLAFGLDLDLRKALGARYREALEARVQAVEQATAAFQAQAVESSRQTLSPEDLDMEDPEKLRDVLGAAFATIAVSRGRGKVEDRVRLVFHGSWLGRQVERNLTDLARR